jgi:hypothetical protein
LSKPGAAFAPEHPAVEIHADEIAHGFGTVDIALVGDEGVERPGQVVIERNREALHGWLSVVTQESWVATYFFGKK